MWCVLFSFIIRISRFFILRVCGVLAGLTVPSFNALLDRPPSFMTPGTNFTRSFHCPLFLFEAANILPRCATHPDAPAEFLFLPPIYNRASPFFLAEYTALHRPPLFPVLLGLSRPSSLLEIFPNIRFMVYCLLVLGSRHHDCPVVFLSPQGGIPLCQPLTPNTSTFFPFPGRCGMSIFWRCL